MISSISVRALFSESTTVGRRLPGQGGVARSLPRCFLEVINLAVDLVAAVSQFFPEAMFNQCLTVDEGCYFGLAKHEDE